MICNFHFNVITYNSWFVYANWEYRCVFSSKFDIYIEGQVNICFCVIKVVNYKMLFKLILFLGFFNN